MMSFLEALPHHEKSCEQTDFASITPEQVKQTLLKPQLSLKDFATLISPAAEAYIPNMLTRAQQITRQRFGHTMQLFAPLYISNLCANECDYCGFSLSNKIKRHKLSIVELKQEIQALKKQGFDHILIVSGEHETQAGMPYFLEILAELRQHFSYIMFETQPLDTDDYKTLHQHGVHGVFVYQETYCRATYAKHHLRGKKQDFNYRLQTAERLGEAGIDKIGLGVLLGLAPWREDSMMLANHLHYLQKSFWRSRYSLSLPRLQPCMNGVHVPHAVSNQHWAQLMSAFRLCFPELEITLSTRETASFRDAILPYGITSISAGSKTQPGGYSVSEEHLEQFEISDKRSPKDMAQLIHQQRLTPVWKDWSNGFM